jgi:hypothetical protein
MKAKLCALAAALCLALASAAAQGAVPASVTPAWILERQFGQEEEAKRLDVFFVGYDYPSLSGPLAPSLEAWNGPVNFSIGFESAEASNFLMGLEGEFLIDIRDTNSRFIFNDMMMLGYSLDLDPVKFNLGCRVGLSLLDVTDDTSDANSYTGLGFIVGPEVSLYVPIAAKTWLWARGRLSRAYYLSMDDDTKTTPISSGADTLDAMSIEAGLAFKL